MYRKNNGKSIGGMVVLLVAAALVIAALILVQALKQGDRDDQPSRADESSESLTGTLPEISYYDPPNTPQTSGQGSASDASNTSGTSGTSGTTDTTGPTDIVHAYAYAGFNPVPVNLNIAEWSLLLMNRDYILPEDYSPALSVAASGYDTTLDARVSPRYQEMFNAAKADGITLVPLSGHRRISTQKQNFEKKITEYRNQGYSKAEATQLAAKIILPPGSSEHNAGLAMDICSLDTSFENTREFKWLMDNAADYGFILRYPKNKTELTRITYEPWHWRYVGENHAKIIMERGICLEEYLGVS
ncbi:MAG: M15 family metallopeptidase [Oscillospiraceae bacterium]|nr:M15 family metallopeptidase [Oscillospiraceae bacterium]